MADDIELRGAKLNVKHMADLQTQLQQAVAQDFMRHYGVHVGIGLDTAASSPQSELARLRDDNRRLQATVRQQAQELETVRIRYAELLAIPVEQMMVHRDPSMMDVVVKISVPAFELTLSIPEAAALGHSPEKVVRWALTESKGTTPGTIASTAGMLSMLGTGAVPLGIDMVEHVAEYIYQKGKSTVVSIPKPEHPSDAEEADTGNSSDARADSPARRESDPRP